MWKGLQDSNCQIQIVCDTSSRVYFKLKSFPSQVIFTGAIEHDWCNPALHPCMGLHNLWNLKAFGIALYTIFMLSKGFHKDLSLSSKITKKILEFSGWYEVSQRFVESTVFHENFSVVPG